MDTRIHVSTVLRHNSDILMVQENKAGIEGRWNLPGGHVELHESVPAAAMREVLEETSLSVGLLALIGAYIASFEQNYFVRFVFQGEIESGTPIPGNDQLAVVWQPIKKVLAMPNEMLVGAAVLRNILEDVLAHKSYPLDLLHFQDVYR